MAGMLYGVGVGPGDPELLTLKAVRIIREADVVAVPDIGHKRQTAWSIAREYLEDKQVLDCSTPMAHDHAVAQAAYQTIADSICDLLDQGKCVAYLTLGDPTIYSSYLYVHDLVVQRGYKAEVVPGVPSFCAVAARLGISLCEGSEQLLVVPARANDEGSALDTPGTKVFMKAGHALGDLRKELERRDMVKHASAVANCGLPDEHVFSRLVDAPEDLHDYFTTVIVHDKA